MVDADDVVDGSGVLDALLPPAEVFGLVAGPVVERVAPELIVGGKGVGLSVSYTHLLLNQKFLIPERNLMMQFEKIVSQMDKQIENLD